MFSFKLGTISTFLHDVTLWEYHKSKYLQTRSRRMGGGEWGGVGGLEPPQNFWKLKNNEPKNDN